MYCNIATYTENPKYKTVGFLATLSNLHE